MSNRTNEEASLRESVARVICEAWAEREQSEEFDWSLLVEAHAQGPGAFPKLHRMYETALAEADAVIAAFDVRFREGVGS